MDECKGFDLQWIETPGEEIRAQEEFNVTYELIIKDEFYDWAYPKGYFSHLSSEGVTNAAEAKAWCETEICATSSGATKMTCCIYHVNVHSCPLEHTDNGLCGPWISPGGTFTHSKVLVGPVDKGNWTSYISGLYQIGVTSLIAHFKFAGMQIALETKTNVLPRYMQWQRRKLLWNEDWIIPPDKIADDEGLRGAFGSMVGSNIGVQGARSQQSSNLNVGHKQVFCRTALFEYSAKGSLSDVLLNEEVPLNWAFRFSFESDIASAMKYLHGRGIIHGHLKANNCVVDDRWTIKITEAKYQQRRSSVYVAPELYSENGFKASMEGDAYAFAILMIEIALRADPYGDEDVFSLKLPWQPALPDFNPDKWENKDDLCPCPEAYNDLIQQCWSKQPSQRLTYDKIKAGIRKINPSNLSAIDLMMNMMEKYSKHLEHGIPVEPKYHDWCSIYFSDVVGFTKLSGKSKPIEVVRMLNNLYIAFDEVIDHYDVYKVETIGDAYMVASGIPDFTEHHAREIANMSIDLVVACQHFVIPHLPDEPLKIRVGLHSGPVCAGVVGIKMPRYCLFGNTVQITSSMESNSIEYKIQISEACQKFLAPYGQFDIEERGKLTVMGVEWTTYWLHGRLPGYDPLAYSDEQ
ncbi:ANPRA-like protein [Mya arenaria]|uniref:guanylate cyclase n=1 Tax=Mya arenaria TaxID=6604 RepID=A0ABY7FUP1_MYAAR|nr:ANPRA-like protein [Mya arenaria]